MNRQAMADLVDMQGGLLPGKLYLEFGSMLRKEA